MKYTTINELEHFDFGDAYITDIQCVNGFFHMVLDNVTILPKNSCNRDIRQMRANQLALRIHEGVVTSLVEEGYKVYNANGELTNRYEDQIIAPEQYPEFLKLFVDGTIYALEKKGEEYVFSIDANERTYVLHVAGTQDVEEWNRFLSK